MVVAHLSETLITEEAVATAMRDLDDCEAGAGAWPMEVRIGCHKCEEEIDDSEMMGVAFGNYYHASCVPQVNRGPLPLGQYLGGVEGAQRGDRA